MDSVEIRMRCIEAAAKNPLPHPEGYAMGILTTAEIWEKYVLGSAAQQAQGSKTLGLPKKGVSDLK